MLDQPLARFLRASLGELLIPTPLDESHLWNAVRYVEQNPVRAHLVSRCEQWRWPSTRGNALLRFDLLLSPSCPLPGEGREWLQWVNDPVEASLVEMLRKKTSTGRPTGSRGLVEKLEQALGRKLRPDKVGRKPKTQPTEADACDLFTSLGQ